MNKKAELSTQKKVESKPVWCRQGGGGGMKPDKLTEQNLQMAWQLTV